MCVFGDSAIATGSRDKSIRCWYPTEGDKVGYVLGKTLIEHTSFVGPVSWIPPSEELPSGGLVSGGMDARVIVWNLETSTAIQDLRGHELQVTAVAVDDNGDFLSASLDRYVLAANLAANFASRVLQLTGRRNIEFGCLVGCIMNHIGVPPSLHQTKEKCTLSDSR